VDGKWKETFVRMGFSVVNDPEIRPADERPTATSEQIDACYKETEDPASSQRWDRPEMPPSRGDMPSCAAGQPSPGITLTLLPARTTEPAVGAVPVT
jgi:hypothetical protein